MGWELHLCFPHPKWSSSPLYDPRGIWNSPHELCRVCWLDQEHCRPRHPSTSYRLWWVDLSHSLGSSSLQPWIFLDYIHYGQSSVDRTATLSMRFRPLYAPDLVIHDLPNPWPIHDILDHHWALPSMTRIIGTINFAYDYFPSWNSAPICRTIHPERALSTSGAIPSSKFMQRFPPTACFRLFNLCKGFLLLHVFNYSFQRLPVCCIGAPAVHPLVHSPVTSCNLKIYLVVAFNQLDMSGIMYKIFIFLAGATPS